MPDSPPTPLRTHHIVVGIYRIYRNALPKLSISSFAGYFMTIPQGFTRRLVISARIVCPITPRAHTIVGHSVAERCVNVSLGLAFSLCRSVDVEDVKCSVHVRWDGHRFVWQASSISRPY